MAALAGAVADGLIGNPLFSPRHLGEVVLPALGRGLSRAGRRRSDVEVLGQCFAVIEDDTATAYRAGAGALLFSIWGRIYDGVFAAHGFGDVVERVRASPDPGAAVAAIPREMVDAFCAVGSVDRVRARVRERQALLDTVILAVPSGGTTREQQDLYRTRLLEAFAS
jgi:alkanesulfonate monooxygenase SsuD/methylene tetrahydromethanopterin reductase-like flavin-dependent oxidoreductase (luciferase family)